MKAFTRIIATAALTAASVTYGAFALFEDFEDVSDWVKDGGAAADLSSESGVTGGTGNVGQLSHDSIDDSSSNRTLAGLSIAENSTGTVFYRINVPTFAGDTDASHWFGVTDNDNPSGFGDHRTYTGAFATDGSGGVDFLARDQSIPSSEDVGDLSLGTWYNVWMVINNATGNTSDTYDVYLTTGTSGATAGDLVADDFTFRTGTTSSLDVISLFGSTNGGAVASNRPVYFDDIYVDTTGQNLGYAIPEPGTLALVGIALGALLVFRRKC